MKPRTNLSAFVFASLCVLSLSALAAAPVQSSAPALAPSSAKAPLGTKAPSAKTNPSAGLRSRGMLPVSSWTASPEEEAYLNRLFSIAHEAGQLRSGSAQSAFRTAALRLSRFRQRGTPPSARKAFSRQRMKLSAL
jgi:hypothetical protein